MQEVTKIADILKWSNGEIVEIPGWKSDEPVYFRLSRPSMLALAKAGRIPNSLLARASELFSRGSGTFDSNDTEMLSESYDVLRAIADASMLEPKLSELDANGVSLTDEQLIAIFNYSQNGVNKLSQFRAQQGDTERTISI